MNKDNQQEIDITDIQRILPIKLKEFRTRAGLSMRDVAKIIDTSASSISLWECGKNEPSLEHLIKLCQLYKVDFDDFTTMEKIDSNLTYHELKLIDNYRKADTEVKFVVEKILKITTQDK